VICLFIYNISLNWTVIKNTNQASKLGSCEGVNVIVPFSQNLKLLADGKLFFQERYFLQKVELPLLNLKLVSLFQFFAFEDVQSALFLPFFSEFDEHCVHLLDELLVDILGTEGRLGQSHRLAFQSLDLYLKFAVD
jgi:hypothetical protein